MSKTIKISNGEVVLKDFINRRTQREYDEALYKGVNVANFEQLPIINIYAALEVLVLNMVESATKDGSGVEFNSDFINGMDKRDYELISNKAKEIYDSQSDSDKKK